MRNRFHVHMIDGKLVSNSQMAMTVCTSKNIGEKKEGRVFFSSYEAFHLHEKGMADIMRKETKVSGEEFIKMVTRSDKGFIGKYNVYKNLREKGYLVKEGLKFGGDFRVYETHKQRHSKYICIVTEKQSVSTKEIVSRTRIAHSTGKKLLLAIIDKEDSILYYEVDWKKV